MSEVNPMSIPTNFSSVEEKKQWYKAAILIAAACPDQGMQLLAACLQRELDAM